MKRILLSSPIVALSVSCTTLDQSFRLGAVTGALTGAAATYAGNSASGRNPSIEEVGLGASIGLGIGLITSYFVHQQVAEDRDEMSQFLISSTVLYSAGSITRFPDSQAYPNGGLVFRAALTDLNAFF